MSRLLRLGLLGAHVLGRADHGAEAGHERLLGQLRPGGLGHAEVDDLGHRLVVVEGDQDVTGLMSRWMIPFWWACWIAWQTGTNSSSRCRGVSRRSSQNVVMGMPLTSSMTKKGRPTVGGAGVEDPGDVGVVHHGQGLALGLEAGEDGCGSPCRP